MAYHPINLIIRFVLEIIALLSVGLWGWRQGEGWLRLALALGIPLVLTIVWGTFAVPNDPSRSGSAPVATHGIIRLVIECCFFGFAIWAMNNMNFNKMALIFTVVTLVHYIVSYERILWLVSRH